MTKKSWKLGAVAIALASMVVTPTFVNAATFDELVNGGGDAGDLYGTGMNVFNNTTQITGNLSDNYDVDLFRFSWSGTTGAVVTYTLVATGVTDTVLTLVNDSGTVLAVNDDIGSPDPLASGIFLPTTAGNYGIAISSYSRFPTTTGGVLTGWANTAGTSPIGDGSYHIDILQNGVINSPVPEPETYAMLLAGLGLMGFVARRRQRKLAAA